MGDGNGAIEVEEEQFDADRFVVIAGGWFTLDLKEVTDGCQESTELTASVRADESTHANFEEDLLHEEADNGWGGDIVCFGGEDEAGKVVHGDQEVFEAVGADGGAWLPNIHICLLYTSPSPRD